MKVETFGKHTLVYNDEDHLYFLDGVNIPSPTTILNVIDKPGLVYWSAEETLKCVQEKIHPGRIYNDIQLNAIFKYAANARFRTSEEAMNIGSTVHNWIERHIKYYIKTGEFPEVVDFGMLGEGVEVEGVSMLTNNESVNNSITSFLNWLDRYNVEFLSCEDIVCSVKHGWAGTRDLSCIVEEKYRAVIDWKTSKSVNGNHFLQGSAYAYGGIENGEEPYDKVYIVQLPKDGEEFVMKDQTSLGVKYSIERLYNTFLSCKNIYDFHDGKKRRVKKLSKLYADFVV